jgi:hypothetical protein
MGSMWILFVINDWRDGHGLAKRLGIGHAVRFVPVT